MINFVNIENFDEQPYSLVNDFKQSSTCPKNVYFLVENCFSELLTIAQKEKARRNLNISWENMSGNITDSLELNDYINSQIKDVSKYWVKIDENGNIT